MTVLRTVSKALVPAGSRTANFTGPYTPLDEHTQLVEVVIDLTAIARTTTGTLQVLLDASYDNGVTFETPAMAVSQAEIAVDKSRFVFDFGQSPPFLTVLNDNAGYFQDDIDTAPAAGLGRWHTKPSGYRARAVMAGDTTSYNVTVTLRELVTRD